MPMKICSLRPDSKMCCSHLGRWVREHWWHVSSSSLSSDLLFRRAVRKRDKSWLIGVFGHTRPYVDVGSVLTVVYKRKVHKQGAVSWWVARAPQHGVVWTCSQMCCCWVCRTLKRSCEPVWSSTENQIMCLFHSFSSNFLSFHAWSTPKTFAGRHRKIQFRSSPREQNLPVLQLMCYH